MNAGLRYGRRIVPMVGLIDLDVTTARARIAAHRPEPLSMTAFLVACLARAVRQNPEVHGYRDWRGRIVTHDFVDVAVLVEVDTAERPIAFPRVLRDADARSVDDLSRELREAKSEPYAGPAGRMERRWGRLLTSIPGADRLLDVLMARSVRLRQEIGTVAVTSIGMFGGGGGFAISPPTVMSLELVVGGIARRPRVVGDRIEIREIADLVVVIDHVVVDGAPATRFVADFRRLVESASLLDTSS